MEVTSNTHFRGVARAMYAVVVNLGNIWQHAVRRRSRFNENGVSFGHSVMDDMAVKLPVATGTPGEPRSLCYTCSVRKK